MEASNIIICELKGSINSNPQILKSYPLDLESKKSKNLVSNFLPFGSKKGDFLTSKYHNNITLSYIFTIENKGRDDLLSISIIITKKQNIKTFKQVLEVLIKKMKNNGILTEEILISHLSEIYVGIYKEQDINIDGVALNFSSIIAEARSIHETQKPNLRGSFF